MYRYRCYEAATTDKKEKEMTTAPIHQPPTISHATILVIEEASNIFCGLTTHRDGEQIHCAITRRVGSQDPSFLDLMHHTKATLLAGRKAGSVLWIDHEFEVTTARKLLHSFAFVLINASGDITRQCVDLKTHETWAARVQPVVRLLLSLRA
jgi:hypothetical protein